MTQFSDQWAYRFQSVVDELCNNAIEHGSASGQEVKISFLSIPGKYIEIIVEDSGTGKSKLKANDIINLVAQRKQPGYAFTELRGRGLPKIVGEWTDEMEFIDRPEGGLSVRVRKVLRPEDAKKINALVQDPTHLVLA